MLEINDKSLSLIVIYFHITLIFDDVNHWLRVVFHSNVGLIFKKKKNKNEESTVFISVEKFNY